jgi:TonB family protein
MAFRALLFSKNAETNTAMSAACASTGIREEVQSDIFTAIEHAKARPFSCIIVDWADQPEANFLLKRARESASNTATVSVVVVDHEPTPAEMRDNHLDFLIYRPITAAEANAVLETAREKMQPAGSEDEVSSAGADSNSNNEVNGRDENHAAAASSDFATVQSEESASRDEFDQTQYEEKSDSERPKQRRGLSFLVIAGAAALMFGALFVISKSPVSLARLALLPKQTLRVLRSALAGSFTKQPSAPPQITQSQSDAQQDAYLNRDANTTGQTPTLGVVTSTSTLADAQAPLPKAFDFPLPVAVFERPSVAPVRVAHTAIPESMRNSPPIAPPLVVTVNPAQMMPVSSPPPPPTPQQISEPVTVSEDAARALLVHTVNPVYPQEAAAQKLHGPVVLQAIIGRDGSVQDLKIVRGYFILGRAASAAVKQWRFQPYAVNGHAVSTQTVITINFSYPPA